MELLKGAHHDGQREATSVAWYAMGALAILVLVASLAWLQQL